MSEVEEQETYWIRVGLLWVSFALSVLLAGGCSSISDEEASSIAAALALIEGSSVADVGAGDGVLLPHLAAWVGSEGRVFLTEIDPEKVTGLSQLAAELDLQQAIAIQGTTTDTGLDTACCDAIVTRMVYHHFTDPSAFIESLQRALKPGGRLLIVDFKPSLLMQSSAPDDLPEDRDGQHGIAPELVIKEVAARGFVLKQRFEDWSGPGGPFLKHFAVLFVRE